MVLTKEKKIFLLIGSFIIILVNFFNPAARYTLVTHGSAYMMGYSVGENIGSHLSGIIAVAMFIVIGINLIKEVNIERRNKKVKVK